MTILRDISFLWSMLHVIALFLLLFEPRYSWRATLLVSFMGAGTLLAVNVLAMYWLGHGIIMSLAFFTCTLPSMLLFFLLSKYRDGRFFFLFCMSDTTCFWLLQITNFLDRMAGGAYVILLLTRLAVFPLTELLYWRYLRRPYLELQSRLNQSWWLFTAVGAVYYLLIMFAAVPVDAPMPGASGLGTIFLVLTLMPLTYMTILRSLWQQMKMYEKTRQLELQHQDYNAIRQKMELGRIYRHDMRHHLSALDVLLQQENLDSARQYIRTLSGKLEELTQPAQCANPVINAVLTAYLAQASNAGCTLNTRLRVPGTLPFEETDLCIILGNALENAIHACEGLSENMRQISLELELTDNQRLILSVKNACPKPVPFGADGLPEVPRHGEHGLGLQSVRTAVNKYGGLFLCQCEDGVFLLRTVLIPPQQTASRKSRLDKITIAVLIFLLCLLVLNCIPATAGVLGSLPVLGPFFQALDLRTYTFYWTNT